MPQTRSKSHESDSVGRAVQDGAQSVMEAGTNIYNAALDRTRHTNEQLTGYVREKPWYALGIATAAGFVLGFLYGRRG